MKTYQVIFLGLLMALLSISDAYAGRRISIWDSSLTNANRTAIRDAIMNWLNSDTGVDGSGNTVYNIVNRHGNNDAYIHNYNEVFLGWHRRYLAEAEAYIMPRLSSTLRNKLGGLLPYWDPTTSIPDVFFDSTNAVLPNFDALVRQTPNSVGAYNFSRFTANNFCENYDNGNSVTYCTAQTGSRTRPIDKFAADLECEHNTVHGVIGGVMAISSSSPAASIFWIWHAYVDELYWEYELCNGKYSGLPYSQSFDNGSNVDIYTYLGSSNRFGRVQVTTANSPQSGSRHLTMDTNTNNNYATNEAIINLSLQGLSNVSLSFWWKEWADEPNDEDGVFISDGGPYVRVFQLTGANTTYRQQTLNLSNLAANNGLSLNNTFKVKFQQHDNYRITSDGIAIDNISITGTMANGHCNDFDSGWDSWANVGGDNGDWIRRSGSTPSSNTGPSSAFTGNHYVYIEASTTGTSYPSNTAILLKQMPYNSSIRSVGFWYHMYGSNMGSLQFQISTSPTSGFSTLWQRSGNQGNSWGGIRVNIPYSYRTNTDGYYLRFIGTTGSSWSSDMAIDNVCFYTSTAGRSAETDDIVLTEEPTLDLRGYPNPFSQSTTIEYTLTEATEVVLTVTDVTGREIKRLVNGTSQQPGVHQVVFNAENIPDGVYLYTLDAQGTRKTGKLILQR